MAKGQKTDNETIYKIMISMFATNNFAETSRLLDIPASTVEKIYKENKDKPEFVELCLQKKDEFVEKASKIIDKLLERIMDELETNDKIPLNQLSTTLGIVCDKKRISESGMVENTTPNVSINIVDNSNLERLMYEEEQ